MTVAQRRVYARESSDGDCGLPCHRIRAIEPDRRKVRPPSRPSPASSPPVRASRRCSRPSATTSTASSPQPTAACWPARKTTTPSSRSTRTTRASVYLAGVAVGSLSIDRQGRLFAVRRMAQANTPAVTQASAPKTSGVSMLLPELKTWDTLTDGTTMMGRPSDLSADSTGGAYFTQQTVYYASPNGRITLIGENVRGNGILLSEDEKRLYVTNDCVHRRLRRPGPGQAHQPAGVHEARKRRSGGRARGRHRRQSVRRSRPWRANYNRDGKYLGVIPTPPGRPTGQALRALTGRRSTWSCRPPPTRTDGRWRAGRSTGFHAGAGTAGRSK